MWYVLLVAVLNLGLGYTVAKYVRGPRSAHETHVVSADAREATIKIELPDETDQENDSPSESESAELHTEEMEQLDDILEGFKTDLNAYRDNLSGLDVQMRECAKKPSSDAYQNCLTGLKDASHTYLKKQGDNVQNYYEKKEKLGTLQSLGDQVSLAVDEQAMSIASVNKDLEAMATGGNLASNCQQLIEQSSTLIKANVLLKNTMDDVTEQVHSERSAGIDPNIDPLTKLSSKQRVDEFLREWWERDPHRSRTLAMAIIDMDHFSELSDQYGPLVVDRILKVVAQFVDAGRTEDGVAARVGDFKFALLLPDVQPSNATGEVERVRQNVEATTLSYGEDEISITASCAVTGVVAADTSETLLRRAETTLEEARRYGRNRTFLHEGKYPAPVVPPSLPIENRTLPI